MDEEHFAEVGLRLTPRFRRELRLTKFILYISSTSKTGNCRVGANNLDSYMHLALSSKYFIGIR